MYYLISIQKGCLELIDANKRETTLIPGEPLPHKAVEENDVHEAYCNNAWMNYSRDYSPASVTSEEPEEKITMVVSSKLLEKQTGHGKEDLEFLIENQCISPNDLRSASTQIW